MIRSDVGFVLRDAWVIAEKDLRVELRSKEILLTLGYFGFLVVLIFGFTFYGGDAPIAEVAAGILWVAIAFTGTLGLNRVFDREREGDCLRAVMLTPVSRAAIFLGKSLSVFLFIMVVEAVVVPSVAFFFNLSLDLDRSLRLLLILILGTVGYATVGTLMAAMLMRARSKEVLLVVVFFPIILPVIIVGAKATGVLLQPALGLADWLSWVKLLVGFDIVFLVAALWIFELLLLD